MGVGVYFNVAVNGIPIIAWWNATYLVVVSLWCGAGSIVDVKPAESSLKAIRQLNSTLALSCHRQVCLPTQLNFSRKQYPVAWLMMNYLHQTMQCRHVTLAPTQPRSFANRARGGGGVKFTHSNAAISIRDSTRFAPDILEEWQNSMHIRIWAWINANRW